MARPPQRQERLFRELTQKIHVGEYAPGSRIPSRSDLAKDYKVSPVTMQRVFDRLIDDGYVCPRGRSGSFVTEAPPHLSHYWVIFQHQEPGVPAPFCDAMIREVRKFARGKDETFSIHVGHGGHFREGNYRKLLQDVKTHRVAGLIFTTAGSFWNDTPLRNEPGIPRVALSHGPEGPKDIALVRFDTQGQIDKALDSCKTKGRNRVAILVGSIKNETRAYLQQAASMREITLEPYWIQTVNPHYSSAAKGLMHLLMNKNQQVRPNALFIMDDALVGSALEGLADAEVSIPDELHVIAHANFPSTPHHDVPLEYLGYDLSVLLDSCLKVLAAQRNGEPLEHVTPLKALFEYELKDR